MPERLINRDTISVDNIRRLPDLRADFDAVANRLARSGVDANFVVAQMQALELAVPSWGVGTGGTRFARFPMAGEPRNIFDKLDDCAVIAA